MKSKETIENQHVTKISKLGMAIGITKTLAAP